MSKVFLSFILAGGLSAAIFITTPVRADNDRSRFLSQTVKNERTQVKQTGKELKQEKFDLRKSIQQLVGVKNAKIVNGVVTTVSDQNFTVTKNGKTYTVQTDTDTRFRRHYWGKSSLAELSVGDNVNVWGTFSDDSDSIIHASMVRNLSVMKFRGVFFGTVSAMNGNTWTVETVRRGNQTVTVSSSARYINRKEQLLTQNEIQVHDRIRLRGLWDKSSNTITQVTEVKDFSLPPLPSSTPSP